MRDAGGWIYGPQGPAWAVHLPDGRWFVVRASPRHRAPVVGLLLVLGGIALAVAVGAYPVVRGLTRRLERLQTGVETLGAGDLATRVKVQGRDEVAQLADAFNRSAARIEELVNAHRLLLANASHELRTPLSRLRLGHRALCENAGPEVQSAGRARHCRAGYAGRRNPAVEQAERPSCACRRSRTSTCWRSPPRNARARRDATSTARRRSCRAMRGCCGVSSVICWRMRNATVRRRSGSSFGVKARTPFSTSSMRGRGYRRTNGSACSRRSIVWGRTPPAPVSACRWCVRSRGSMAARPRWRPHPERPSCFRVMLPANAG